MSPRIQMCVIAVVGLAIAVFFGRWACMKLWRRHDMKESTVHASSVVEDFKPESEKDSIIESTGCDVEPRQGGLVLVGDDIESGGAIRTTDDCSLRKAGAQVDCPSSTDNTHAKTSEKSASALTMGVSSSDRDDNSESSDDADESRSFVTMDSSASDIICLFEARSTCGSSFVSSSSVRSCSSWTTNNDSVVESADCDVESGPERVDLVSSGDDIDSTDDCSLHEGGAQVVEKKLALEVLESAAAKHFDGVGAVKNTAVSFSDDDDDDDDDDDSEELEESDFIDGEDAIRAMLDRDADEAENDNLFRIPAGTDFGIPLEDGFDIICYG